MNSSLWYGMSRINYDNWQEVNVETVSVCVNYCYLRTCGCAFCTSASSVLPVLKRKHLLTASSIIITASSRSKTGYHFKLQHFIWFTTTPQIWYEGQTCVFHWSVCLPVACSTWVDCMRACLHVARSLACFQMAWNRSSNTTAYLSPDPLLGLKPTCSHRRCDPHRFTYKKRTHLFCRAAYEMDNDVSCLDYNSVLNLLYVTNWPNEVLKVSHCKRSWVEWFWRWHSREFDHWKRIPHELWLARLPSPPCESAFTACLTNEFSGNQALNPISELP